MTRNFACRRWILLGGIGLCVMSSAGCYERTVRAEGMGASGVSLQQPYVKNRWGSKKSEFQQLDVKPNKRSSKPW